MSFLSEEQLAQMGFASIGKNVHISDKASFYNCKNISIGNNVRIDDFCVLSAGDGGINLGDYIHIAAFCLLVGAGKITMKDFSGVSSRVSIYSSSDDYSGFSMTNPMIPKKYTRVDIKDVTIGRHVIIGSGSVVLPGVVLEEGVAVGALSLVTKSCEEFSIYIGNPARKLKKRNKHLLERENEFLKDIIECR